MSALAVETKTLTRRFGERAVVREVSMSVPERSVYGFLGRNGAGKTTTLKVLLGLLKPSAGSARLFGVDVAKDRLKAARKVGALMEAHGFYANLSGRENLDLTRTLLGAPRSELDRVLDVVEMREHANRHVSDYSLGMRQRLGIARAMIGAPPLLVLDEPTNGLDPDGIADMRLFLSALPERTGATVLVSSHLLGEIEQTATHVGILHEGRLVVEGSLAQLKAGLAPELAIDVDDFDRAGALAQARGFSVQRTPEALIARLQPRDDARVAAAALNRAFVEAGVAVFSIAHRARSLEGIYRDAAKVGA
ncbi:MAG: ABC transporter ATP-binding protein [Hyphomonadaceae bacterium]|nr:ABC transporter ATP-binding protein [Hyphomonadaceae bacterium]